MNSKNVLLIYFFALVGGILLMIFHGRAQLFESIVTVIGILFLIWCVWSLLQIFASMGGKNHKPEAESEKREHQEEAPEPKPATKTLQQSGLMLVPVLGGIVFGIFLVANPTFFVKYLIYTFGAVMVLCGLAQLVFTLPGMTWMSLSRWWLVPPLVVMAIGIGVFIAGADTVKATITILTGIVLTVYGLEGFIGWLARQSRVRQMEMLDRTAAGDEK